MAKTEVCQTHIPDGRKKTWARRWAVLLGTIALSMSVSLSAAQAHINLTHVPYKGDAPRIIDFLGGHIALLFLNSPAAVSLVRCGGSADASVQRQSDGS